MRQITSHLIRDFFGKEYDEEEFIFLKKNRKKRTMAEETKMVRPRKNRSTGVYIRYGKGGYRAYKALHAKAKSQICFFRSNHSYNKDLHQKHLAYIQREGKGRNGGDPEIYGRDPDGYEQRMSKLHFKWIISPENQNVDLRLLVEEFMHRIEIEKGCHLDWVAAEHYNTGNKHAHILINGFDMNRNRVQFGKEDLRNFMRETLQELCTDQVGTRSQEEIHAASERQVTSNSYTGLDRALEYFLSDTNKITLYKAAHLPNGPLYHKRLMYLKELGLVSYNPSTDTFTYAPDWKETLKQYGTYNTYLDGQNITRAPASRYSFHNPEKAGPITGKIIHKYFMQDNSNKHAVILETSPGYFMYVPLTQGPKEPPVGSNVKIEFQRLAAPNGGTRATTIITQIS